MSDLVIGLMGKKRSGKDSFAQRLVEEHGFTKVALADPLRQAALALDPIVGAEVDPRGGAEYGYGGQVFDIPTAEPVHLSEVVREHGWEAAKDHWEYGAEVRRILQRLGTESIRALDQDFWVRAAWRTIEAIDGPVVITDVRYPNEAMSLQIARRRGVPAYLVRITRPGLKDDGDAHPSETALDGWPADYYVDNDRGLAELHQQADDVLGSIHRKIIGAGIQ